MLRVFSSLALEEMILNDVNSGRPVYIAGTSEQVKERLEKPGVLQKLAANPFFDARADALKAANNYLSGKNHRQLRLIDKHITNRGWLIPRVATSAAKIEATYALLSPVLGCPPVAVVLPDSANDFIFL